jgi:predicted O-methyltransferase YrrM
MGPLPPGGPLKSAAQRAWLAIPLPRLALRRDGASRALAAALRDTALGRVPPEEREWAERIERRRRALIASAATRSGADLGVVDFAAAVEWMSVPPVLGRFLMRLVRELRPAMAVELGTGFGISGAYQGAALELNGWGRLVTIDVAAAWSGVAGEGFAALGLERVEAVVVPDAGIGDAIAAAAPIDFALVDSDHRRAQTLSALDRLAPHLAPGAAVAFDDVGFTSSEMNQAWREIRADPRVASAARFARMGVAVAAGR